MHGDFSRVIFDPARRFSSVLSQQGRVQLDADFNEQTAILLHYVRTLASDLLGPAAYPPDPDGLGGFGIDGYDGDTFSVAPGRMYVDGILCECDGTDYWDQPDGHLDPELDQLPAGPFLVYLRVWERFVTAREAPWIRETALGPNGPDTTARTRVVWQVCVLPLEPGADTPDMRSAARFVRDRVGGRFEPRGMLAARTRRPEEAAAPADGPVPSSGYRGPENQLYRVEVHRGGREGTATFKWSRENGSVVLPVRGVSGPVVELETLGRDDKLGVDVGDVVEIVDDAVVCRGASDRTDEAGGRLYTVQGIDYDAYRVTLDGDVTEDPFHRSAGQVPTRHPLLRRWDHGAGGWDGVPAEAMGVPLREGEWLPLEDGVEVRFETGQDRPRVYRRGDYWLIPARVLTGDVEWPRGRQGQPLKRRPHGVRYHYAPLALLEPRDADDFRLVDLRMPFAPRR
ncbi:DUF6519 domain-containing protein [Streptomyces hydrogenans]|uniref:DUF6519 domain-containing protein n=1 Tax=Streptomyces hydrogenans TaxID=1873719 RepID=UPI00345D2C0F